MYTFVVKEVIFLSLIHCDAQPLLMFSGVFKTLETKG